FAAQERFINTLLHLFGFLSLPILSSCIVGRAFRNFEARASIVGVVAGVALYAILSFVWTPVHYIHAMFITLAFCVATSLGVNALVFGKRAMLTIGAPAPSAAE
ncbi:MAG: SLC5 family protein, partial [Parvularculaceae bacterium]